MAKKQSYLKKKQSFSGAQVLLFVLIFAAVGTVAIWQSLAAPHNGKGGGGSGNYTSSLSYKMVADKNVDGLPNWDDSIALVESTNYVDPGGNGPWASLTCSQNGTVVYSATTGYGPGYPWPWTRDSMELKSTAWTGGAADCSAKLYYASGKKYPTLATTSFHVNP